jgi:outer membrane protein TolC
VNYVFLLIFFVFLPSATARPIAFAELRSLITANNELAAAGIREIEASSELIGHLNRSLTPDVQLQAGFENYTIHERNGNNSLSDPFWQVQAVLNIYRGGRDLLRDDELKAEMSRSALNRDELLSYLQYQAERYYWQALKAKKQLELIESTLQRLHRHLAEVDRRVANKVLREADQLKLQIFINRLKADQLTLSLERDEATNKLALILNISDHRLISIDDSFPNSFAKVSIPPIYEVKVTRNKILEVESEILRLRSSQARSGVLPEVDIFGRYGRPAGSDEYNLAVRGVNESVIGVRVNWSLGRWQEDRVQGHSLASREAAVRLRQTYEHREREAELHELEHDLATLAALIQRGTSDTAIIVRFSNLVASDFSAGLRSNEEVLSSIETLFEHKLRLINNQERYLASKAKVERLLR